MNDWPNEDVPDQPAVRFCSQCGAALMPEDAGCAACIQAEADAWESSIDRKPELPTFKIAMLLFGLLLASFLPTAVLDFDSDLQEVFNLQNAVQIIDALLVIVFALICWKATLPLFQKVPLVWCLAMIPLGVVTMGIATGFMELVMTAIGFEEEVYYSEAAFEAGYGWGFLILTIVVQPAIIEELAFRGVIFDGVRKTLSDRETVIVTALMFMALHLNNLVGFPYLLMLGLILGFVRLKTGSIWPCIILHAVHNGMVLAAEYWALS